MWISRALFKLDFAYGAVLFLNDSGAAFEPARGELRAWSEPGTIDASGDLADVATEHECATGIDGSAHLHRGGILLLCFFVGERYNARYRDVRNCNGRQDISCGRHERRDNARCGSGIRGTVSIVDEEGNDCTVISCYLRL